MQEETQKEVQEIQSPNKIDFVTVKKRTNGKDTLHAFVNGIRFNCAKTDKVTGKNISYVPFILLRIVQQNFKNKG